MDFCFSIRLIFCFDWEVFLEEAFEEELILESFSLTLGISPLDFKDTALEFFELESFFLVTDEPLDCFFDTSFSIFFDLEALSDLLFDFSNT